MEREGEIKGCGKNSASAGIPWRKRMEFGAQRPQMKLALEFGFATYKPWDLVLLALVRIKWGKNG